ncbi:MAG: A/G-specific adenine glycosylase, partial [Bacteroidetes bacterium]|nr:A/G-specific adenine glycosylase [Bacteroidota bacterium]
MCFDFEIINWYSYNKRDLPWRETKDPYFIWLSEIILQQTRIDQGLDYYNKFARNFPDIHSLANASEDEVLKLWQGLGYYTRARNLHHTAIYISKELKGAFPNEFSEIIKLKGIGRYTASAIASFAFDQKHPVLDGNVSRIITRFYGIETPIDSKKGETEIYEILDELISNNNPSLFNQAIMEFGALQCKPHHPNCINCPLVSNCIAYQKKTVERLPYKEKKIKQTNRYFNYLIIKNNSHILLNKRKESDIWKNLFEFPLIETDEIENIDAFHEKLLTQTDFQNTEIKIEHISKIFIHKLTHQKIQARFIHLNF